MNEYDEQAIFRTIRRSKNQNTVLLVWVSQESGTNGRPRGSAVATGIGTAIALPWIAAITPTTRLCGSATLPLGPGKLTTHAA